MGKLVKCCLIFGKEFSCEVKPTVDSFEGSNILVTQAKANVLSTGLDTLLLKIKDQYECLVKHIEKMESVKYTIKEAM